MPDAAPEIVYTGAAQPPSWRERLRAHTPEAHYQDIMQKYFWVTDRLEGRSLELVQKIRPTMELYAKAAGWSQTIMELYLAGSAVAITAILAGKGLKSAGEVFVGLARRHPRDAGGAVMDTGDVQTKARRSATRNLTRTELLVARRRLKDHGVPAVMVGGGRILSHENGRVTELSSYPALLDGTGDQIDYYRSLPLDERRDIEARSVKIRESRKQGITPGTKEAGKVKIELAAKHQAIFRRAFEWFRDRYSSHATSWNTSVGDRVSQRRMERRNNHAIMAKGDVTPRDIMMPDAANAFAKHFWQLVQDVGGEDAYRQRVEAIRQTVKSPSDGMKALADAFNGELSAVFPKGEQSGLSPFVYDLMNMEFPS